MLAGALFGAAGPACAPKAESPDSQAGGGSSDVAEITLDGVDTSALTTREKREWSRSVSQLLAPCPDVPVSIAQCVQEKRGCSRCVPAAKFVLRGVRDGLPPREVERRYHARYDGAQVKAVSLDDSPAKGPDNAPVTIVEFADFECPFCAKMFGKLHDLFAQNPGRVRIVYKFYPLPMHPHATIAARAGIAAMKQGKFWEMHDKMFQNQKHLEESDLERYAREIGLDLARYRLDFDSPETTDRIARDRKAGDAAGVQATPTLFINGREFDLKADLDEWVAQEGASPSAPAATEAPKK